LPAVGYVGWSSPAENLRHLVLPVIVLATGFAAALMRQTRSAMLDSLGADYVRTARSKGLSEWRVVGRHALRNSLITVATLIALDFGALLSGAAITESIFGLPGFGRLGLDAINQRDYTTVQGVVLVTAVIWVVVNLLVDVVYSLLDPRIRLTSVAR
jgi:peptide/nickel transport system permease protein